MGRALRSWWQAKQSAWMRKRIAPGAHTLGKRSIFILPTRQGVYLAFFLLAMLLACINYNLSLGYMLTFFVFSVALGAMHRTHQNVLGLRCEVLPCEPLFSGDTPALRVNLNNPSALLKHAVHLSTKPASKAAISVQSSIDSAAQTRLELPLQGLRRGIHALPALEISSAYPLGLWRAWSYVFPQGEVTVYPQPQSPLPTLQPLPAQSAAAPLQIAANRDTQGDAVSHIESADAATAQTIHWASLAKGQLAQRILDSDTPLSNGVLIRLAGCTVVGLEAQLSQLCFAIQHCQANTVPFVLQLGGVNYPTSEQADTSPAHVQQCLQALAAYE